MGKITKEKFKTYNNVFDNFTIRNLFDLSARNIFDDLISPIALGKEANVFFGMKGDRKLIVKIYRLETCDFNKMYDYLRTDPRYSSVKRSRRQVIFTWTQREFRNLQKAREAGIKVPIPYYFKHNILFEEFIGDDDPAPKLKDAVPKNKTKFFKAVIDSMVNLYENNLVHGDLSEFNILNYNETPIIIDWSQAMDLKSYNAREMFERDLNNVFRYFRKIGLNLDDKKKESILEKLKK